MLYTSSDRSWLLDFSRTLARMKIAREYLTIASSPGMWVVRTVVSPPAIDGVEDWRYSSPFMNSAAATTSRLPFLVRVPALSFPPVAVDVEVDNVLGFAFHY